MNRADCHGFERASFAEVQAEELRAVEGGFGGGFPMLGFGGGGGNYDGTSWEVDSDGMCYANGMYY